jgi:hypothetical protein
MSFGKKTGVGDGVEKDLVLKYSFSKYHFLRRSGNLIEMGEEITLLCCHYLSHLKKPTFLITTLY